MGLFFPSKKPAMPFSSKPGVSSGLKGLNTRGVITSSEFKRKITPALTRAFGRTKGANIENMLIGDTNHSGYTRSMTGREATETLKHLGKNSRDDLSNKEIEKLKGIISSQL
ncbi:MAG: hypothetical protein AAB547_00765 [Patescibacteria group bacterium]